MDNDYGFFEYKVTRFDNYAIDEEHKWGQLKTVYGVAYAATFKEAMEKIEKYYDQIEKVELYELEPWSVYEFGNEDNSIKVEVKNPNLN